MCDYLVQPNQMRELNLEATECSVDGKKTLFFFVRAEPGLPLSMGRVRVGGGAPGVEAMPTHRHAGARAPAGPESGC